MKNVKTELNEYYTDLLVEANRRRKQLKEIRAEMKRVFGTTDDDNDIEITTELKQKEVEAENGKIF